MIDRKIKIKILSHYEGVLCICGKKKPDHHWLCNVCRDRFKDTPEGKRLGWACDEHVNAGIAYLTMVKGNI